MYSVAFEWIFCLCQFDSIGLQFLVLCFLNDLLVILSIMNMGIKTSCYQYIFICFSLLFFQCFFFFFLQGRVYYGHIFSCLLCLIVSLCFSLAVFLCVSLIFVVTYFSIFLIFSRYFFCDYHKTYIKHTIVTNLHL